MMRRDGYASDARVTLRVHVMAMRVERAIYVELERGERG